MANGLYLKKWLARRNVKREVSSHLCAVWPFDDGRISRTLADRMQDAKADSVSPECGPYQTVHRECDGSGGVTEYCSLPEEVDTAHFMLRVKRDPECIV
jgi:hypothetical protein